MSYKLAESVKMVSGIKPMAYDEGTDEGIIIDRQGFYDGKVLVTLGDVTGTPTALKVTVKMQSGNESDGSDMADTGEQVEITESDISAQIGVDLNPCGRYIRAVVVTDFTDGTTPAIPVAVSVALGNPANIPV